VNERFKQIAQEAFFDESTNGPGQKMYMFGELKMQKFAELIVRECINVMKQNDYHGEWLGERVKEHFGIKE